jgi:DNA primase RepB-like protein
MAGIGANSLGATVQSPGTSFGRLEGFPVKSAFACQPAPEAAANMCSDHGLLFSVRAIRRQLVAMPCDRYLIRLVHYPSRKALPGQRLWTAAQLISEPIVRFLRARNRDRYDVYFQPYAPACNAGYILVDLDQTQPTVLDKMRANGHEPCTVIETSPGRLQAWIRVGPQWLPAAVATIIARQLALLYQGDRASADWRHVGRLAGLTNQKPQRRLASGRAPWVKVLYARLGLASQGRSLVEAACQQSAFTPVRSFSPRQTGVHTAERDGWPAHDSFPPAAAVTPDRAIAVYHTWLQRLQIRQRFPQPDWSIVDLWVAKQLLRQNVPTVEVESILRRASPQFPRSHADPDDYLRRTLARAAQELARAPFPARGVNDSG